MTIMGESKYLRHPMSVMGQLLDANFTSPNFSNRHEAARDVEQTENGHVHCQRR